MYIYSYTVKYRKIRYNTHVGISAAAIILYYSLIILYYSHTKGNRTISYTHRKELQNLKEQGPEQIHIVVYHHMEMENEREVLTWRTIHTTQTTYTTQTPL